MTPSVQLRQEMGGDICLTTLEKKETFDKCVVDAMSRPVLNTEVKTLQVKAIEFTEFIEKNRSNLEKIQMRPQHSDRGGGGSRGKI